MTTTTTTTFPLCYISNRNTVLTGSALISLLPTLAHINRSHSVFTWSVCTKYCVYPSCGRHTGHVHHADTDKCQDVSWCCSRTKQFDTWSWNVCGSSLEYNSFRDSCLYVGKTGNRTAKLWNVSGWTADRHIVCWLRTALFCDVTPCSLVTVVHAADKICGTARVHSWAVADQSNCSPGHDAVSGW